MYKDRDVHAEARSSRRKIIIWMGKGPGQSVITGAYLGPVIPAKAGIHINA